MEMNFEKMLAEVTNHLGNLAETKTIVGEPFQLGEYTCVAVTKIGIGFGTGGGGGNEKNGKGGMGGAAGGGIGMQPIGFLVSRGDQIAMINAEKSKGLSAVIEKIPDLFEKFVLDKKEEKNKELPLDESE